MRMRIFLVCLLSLVACTKRNPDVCCRTAEECSNFGLDGITPCDTGRTCDDTGTCVAAQCATSADCTSTSSTPICENQLCIASCSSDDECVGIAGRPHCATDGACVACITNDDCTADAPICDGTSRACRGCSQDDDCAGGICIESKGTCVADADVFFVSQVGADANPCTRAAPCKTLEHVVPLVSAQKQTVHILTSGLTLAGAPSMFTFDFPVYVDGIGTTIFGPSTGPVFTIQSSVTLSHLVISPTSGAGLSIVNSATLTLFDVTDTTGVTQTGGALLATASTFGATSQFGTLISCSNGTVSVDTSEFQHAGIKTTNCTAALTRSRFDENGDGGFQFTGGKVSAENNLVVQTSGGNDSSGVFGVLPGSIVRFNTFVSTDAPSDGTAFGCDNSVEVTSNIFAYNTMHPHSPTDSCTTRYSLYDSTALTAQTVGTSNIVGDIATFFVNRSGNDFHLKSGSPAIGAGESMPDLVDDFEGNARPNPAGSAPDIGAFEAAQ